MGQLKSRILSQSAFRYLVAILVLAHFAYPLLRPKEWIDLKRWERMSCYFEGGERKISDFDCRYFFTRRFVLAQPYLKYGETLNCVRASTSEGQTFIKTLPESAGANHDEGDCKNESRFWGSPENFPDLGWDAYSIWYGRAAALYYRAQANDWPGIVTALNDKAFIHSFPNTEHYHYPWLVPVIYSKLLQIQGSANPLVLIIAQILLWMGVGALFWTTWRQAPLYLWISFAFVPTAGIFLIRLYADLWVAAALLVVLLAMEKRWWLLWCVASVAVFWIKQEAYFQWLVLVGTWILSRHLWPMWNSKKWARLYWIPIAISLAAFKIWSAKFYDGNFYVSLVSRLHDIPNLLHISSMILGYYLDVLFRPMLWGLLWPLCFYLFYKERKKLGWAVLPILLLIVAIPISFLSFPFGYKEVVLTGSGRALWQALPTLWLLLKVISEKPNAPALLQ